jgi:hypothetical protein
MRLEIPHADFFLGFGDFRGGLIISMATLPFGVLPLTSTQRAGGGVGIVPVFAAAGWS